MQLANMVSLHVRSRTFETLDDAGALGGGEKGGAAVQGCGHVCECVWVHGVGALSRTLKTLGDADEQGWWSL